MPRTELKLDQIILEKNLPQLSTINESNVNLNISERENIAMNAIMRLRVSNTNFARMLVTYIH